MDAENDALKVLKNGDFDDVEDVFDNAENYDRDERELGNCSVS